MRKIATVRNHRRTDSPPRPTHRASGAALGPRLTMATLAFGSPGGAQCRS